MNGLSSGLIASQGEMLRNRRTGPFNKESTPPASNRLTRNFLMRPAIVKREVETRFFFRYQVPSNADLNVWGAGSTHRSAPTANGGIGEWGSSAGIDIPQGQALDAIEIITRKKPIHPDFIAATGDHMDYRRHKIITMRTGHGLNILGHISSTRNTYANLSPTTAKRLTTLYYLRMRPRLAAPSSRYIYTAPVMTLAVGSTEEEATYRIWTCGFVIPGWYRRQSTDMHPRSSLTTSQQYQLQAWAKSGDVTTDSLRKRTSYGDMRHPTNYRFRYFEYLPPGMVGMEYYFGDLTSGKRQALYSIDLSDIIENQRLAFSYL